MKEIAETGRRNWWLPVAHWASQSARAKFGMTAPHVHLAYVPGCHRMASTASHGVPRPLSLNSWDGVPRTVADDEMERDWPFHKS